MYVSRCVQYSCMKVDVMRYAIVHVKQNQPYCADYIIWVKVTIANYMYNLHWVYVLSTVSFQLTGGTHMGFSVQNYFVISQVLSELLWDVPSSTKSTINLHACKKLKCVALPQSIVVELEQPIYSSTRVLKYVQTDVPWKKIMHVVPNILLWWLILTCMCKPNCWL